MQDVDAATEPYEAARNLLAGTKRYTYVSQELLAAGYVPSLPVARFRLALEPLLHQRPRRLDAAALPVGRSGVVPAQNVQKDHGASIASMRRDAHPASIEAALIVHFETYGLAPVLSHIAVGSASSTPLLTPTVPTKCSFGTLLVVLPTHHHGGQVTATYMGFSKALVTDATSATYAVVHRGASLSVTPVKIGHVVIAVFDSLTSARRATSPLSRAPPSVVHDMIGFAVHAGAALEYLCLPHHLSQDTAFLAAQFESKAFDVAAVLVYPRLGNTGASSFQILRGTMHPALGLEPNVIAHLVYRKVPVFLRNLAQEPSDTEPKNMLGGASYTCNEYDCPGIFFSADLGRQVNGFGDIGLVKRFWAKRATVVCMNHLHLFASTIQRAFELFGVDALMPALEALLSSWQVTWAHFASSVRLVASLVGVSGKAEYLPQHVATMTLDYEDSKELMQVALANAVRLESYLFDDPLHGKMPRSSICTYQDCLPPVDLAPTQVPWLDALLQATTTSDEIEPFDVDGDSVDTGDECDVQVVASHAANVLCAFHAVDALDAETLTRILVMARRAASEALALFLDAVAADAALLQPRASAFDPLRALILHRDNDPDLHRAFEHRLQQATTPFDRELALDVAFETGSDDCESFDKWLRSPTMVTRSNPSPVCATIRVFAAAHAHVLDTIDMHDTVVVTKRLPQHERRDQAAIMMLWLQRRLAEDDHARRHANTVDGNTVNDDDDEPAPKRLKSS
ncbi:hypothetical protein SDRG_03205 [Saprolegnia diclina VS20]|uniref:Uncharacterized protein n=1 Tax=Saprolegnia diclina (strain VS20) TaxID=1156394 RepID=T0R0C8_SAPDV|nr:hypothetical protein SDRG_03205 [Saprolegnia diclina VS20]EQC39780.1 hypothetical protein SDRG_03205 [Saprolegnia diclina VS20]|eukprot:XP_008607052.1 hypothetical protein SDRG_03205 [Saprolegnia diclina VS20]